MKVLFINTVGGIGSTGKICVDLYNEISKEGNNCCIAFGRGTLSNDFTQYKIGGRLNVYSHLLASRILDNNGLSSKVATKKFIKFIESFNPDIINIHNLHGYYLNYKILFDFLKTKKYKIVWTFHDCWPFSSHAAFTELENHDKKVSKKELSEYPKTIGLNQSLRNYKQKKVSFSGLKDTHLVVPSLWMKKNLEKTFFNQYPITLINNGIDKNIFYKKSKENVNKDSFILGVANIWDQRKGLDFFVNLSKKVDDLIVIIGKLDKENKKKVSDCKNIKHIEQTENREQLAEYYRQALVFLNPTLQDNYPTTNLEAIACGTPVITFDTGGSGEVINKYTGVLCKEKTVDSVLKSLELIKKNYGIGVYNSLGNDHNEFSKEKMVSEYLDLIKKIYSY
ncbi:glycosyltransferase [Enterococcus gallinarum]|uniref:glycosyltransferase n=1 Tax=Enterococcus gallinarum TaxID=1353 RepID=UPI003D6A08D2